MKIIIKLFIIVFVSIFSVAAVKAQTPFSTDSHVLHGGLGLGGYGGNFGLGIGVNSSPILNVTYDQGIIDNFGIGNLGVGGGIAAKFYAVNNSNVGWTRIFLSGRATYHFDFVNSDSFDFYAGVMTGFYFESSNDDSVYSPNSDLFGGPIAGINYWLTPTFGIYGETGFGFGFLNGGVSYQF
jgi:hypothetical protein